MFDTLNPFQYLSWRENEIDSLIIDFVHSRKYVKTSKADIDNFLSSHHLNYHDLSISAKNKLDELDI